MQNKYIADTHFGHRGSLKFENRPWQDVDEMNHELIALWDSTTTDKDSVFILGDFAFHAEPQEVMDILKQLKGKKHLLRGNHDKFLDKPGFDWRYFEWVKDIHYLHDNGKRIVLCRYPMAVWQNSHHGAIHFYGHVHLDGFEQHPHLELVPNAYNVCGWIPRTADEILAINGI